MVGFAAFIFEYLSNFNLFLIIVNIIGWTKQALWRCYFGLWVICLRQYF